MRKTITLSALLLPFTLLALTACEQGGAVMLQGSKPQKATPVEQVELLLSKPQKPFKVVAMVTASSKTAGIYTVSFSEADALQKLKEYAAEAGADAVYDIKQEIMDSGGNTSSFDWGHGTAKIKNPSKPKADMAGWGGMFSSTDLKYEVRFTGKAIKYP